VAVSHSFVLDRDPIVDVNLPGIADISTSLLLKEYNSHEVNRYGAYSFFDAVKGQATVDWTAMRELVNRNPQLQVIPLSAGAKYLLGGRNGDSFDFMRDLLRATFQLVSQTMDLNLTQSQLEAYVERLDSFIGVNFNATTISRSLEAAVRNSVNSTGGISGDVRTIDVLDALSAYGEMEYLFAVPSAYTILHNTSSAHGMAAYTGSLVAAAFEQCTGFTGSSYVSRNHPLPLTALQSLEIKVILSILTSLFMLIPLCYIPAAFVAFIVKERVSKSKQLQYISGVSPYLYWAATYLWDMCLYSILTGCVLIAFVIYGKSAAAVFVSDIASTVSVFLLIYLYGMSSIALSYIYSFAFENHSSAQISIMTINFMTGFVAVLAYYVLVSIPTTAEVGNHIVNFFRLFPAYNVGEGLVNLSVNYYQNYILGRNVSALSWYVTGRNVAIMASQAVVFLAIVLVTESGPLRRLSRKMDKIFLAFNRAAPPQVHEEDMDVAAEKQRLQGLRPDQEALIIQDLVKIYRSYSVCGEPKHAVQGISVGCKVGEIFGLLGVNGAGKSTTIGVLTGDMLASSGSVYIAGLPLSYPSIRTRIGYCPQEDPLLELMTGHETLTFFGRISGADPVALEQKVHELVEAVGLTKYAHKPCGTYSGGNKRKLSLAVSLIGDSRVLFLDEVCTYSSVILWYLVICLCFDFSLQPAWIRKRRGIFGK